MKVICWLLFALASCFVQASSSYEPVSISPEQNKGNLTGHYWLPSQTPKAMVVLLHGCGQNAIDFAEQSGLIAEAKKHHWLLLLPQQSNQNNVASCFNWFSKQDHLPELGESASIMAMVNQLQQAYSIKQTHLVGFSAGGAFASALLLTHPHHFNSGVVVAGLPFPCADNLIKAISCMKSGSGYTGVDLAKQLSSPVAHNLLPSLMVITGDNDKVVNPINSKHMVAQWRFMMGAETTKRELLQQGSANQWSNGNTRLIEIIIPELGHQFTVTEGTSITDNHIVNHSTPMAPLISQFVVQSIKK